MNWSAAVSAAGRAASTPPCPERRRGMPPSQPARTPALLVLCLLFLAACGDDSKKVQAAPRPAEPEVDFTLIDSPSLQFLPRHQEAQGWLLEEDPIVVPGERMGTYLGADGQHFNR